MKNIVFQKYKKYAIYIKLIPYDLNRIYSEYPCVLFKLPFPQTGPGLASFEQRMEEKHKLGAKKGGWQKWE